MVFHKPYGVFLEEDIVRRAKIILKNYRGKLSPIINDLLKVWVIQEEKNRGIKNI